MSPEYHQRRKLIMKLTAQTIRSLALPQDKDDKVFFDETLPGFGLRLRRTGGKTWLVQWGAAGKTRRYVIGPLAVFDPNTAREEARKILSAVHLGRDPVQEKAQNKASAAETFESCVKLYLQRRRNDAVLKPTTLREIERHLTRNLAVLNSRPIAAIDRREIAIQLARITDESGPVQSNRTRQSVVTFLNWCAGEAFVDSNAALLTNRNPEAARERLLTDAELHKIWRALPDSDFGSIVKLLALTAQRKSEISGLAWDEIDFDQAMISLPPSRTKNHCWHYIPLSQPALALLQAQPRGNDRSLVFGRRESERGFSGWGHAKRVLDAAVQIPGWVLHDLRRYGSSTMGALNVQPHIIELVLNHRTGTRIASTYNKYLYLAEKRAATDRLGAHIMAVIEGKQQSNITSLRRA
jgi:integrase